MLNNNSNFAKELFEGLNNQEQEEMIGQLLSKQHNIVNDFRDFKVEPIKLTTDSEGNIMEPIADLIYKGLKGVKWLINDIIDTFSK